MIPPAVLLSDEVYLCLTSLRCSDSSHPAFLLEVSMSTISEVLGRRVQLKGLIGKRAMKCPYCDFYFMKNGSDLQRHIWAHEGEYSSFQIEHLVNFVLPSFILRVH